MSTHIDINELTCEILGYKCLVEDIDAEGTKGRGSKQTRFICTNANSPSDVKWVFAKRNDLSSPVNELLHVVKKETLMYDEIIPCFLEFTDKRSNKLKKEIEAAFLQYHGRGIVEDEHIFLFDDLNNKNCRYEVSASDSFHTNTTVHNVVKLLAKFHGVSYSMKSSGINFMQHPLLMKHYLYREKSRPLVAPFYNGEFKKTASLLEVLLSCYGNCNNSWSLQEHLNLSETFFSKVLHSLNKLQSLVPDPLQLHSNIETGISHDNLILIHGDFHPLNIAFSSTAAKFFDFQLIRYSDGLIDLHQYLCQATTPNQREDNLDLFLETYFNVLNETCYALGTNNLPYKNMQDFRTKYNDLAPWQIPFGFGMLLWKFVTNHEAYSKLASLLENVRTSDGSEGAVHKEIVETVNELGPNIWTAINILLQYVVELEQRGILDNIKHYSNS